MMMMMITTTTTVMMMMMMIIIVIIIVIIIIILLILILILIILIIIMIIITIIITALKATIRDFYDSSLRRETPARTLKWPGRNRVQITCNAQSGDHVQHVVCHVVRRDSSPIKFDRV